MIVAQAAILGITEDKHPALSPSPIAYPPANAAEAAIKRMRQR